MQAFASLSVADSSADDECMVPSDDVGTCMFTSCSVAVCRSGKEDIMEDDNAQVCKVSDSPLRIRQYAYSA